MPENPPVRIPRYLAASIALLASAVSLIGSAAPASAADATYDTMTVTADPASVDVGDTITVTVAATGVVDAYAYQLALSYDPQLVEYVDDTAILPEGGFGSATDDGTEITAVASRLGTSPGLTGTQTLVSLRFTARAAGDARIVLASGQIVDSAGGTTAIDTTAEGTTASVTIAATENPGTGTGGAGASGSGSGTGTGGGSPQTGEDLASTGADAAPWLVMGGVAVAAIVIGSVFVFRRRTR
ncbi:cohesin domain-containing protein [Microbacterium sp. LWH10-1.2]|uniref:cohesin domain-containing protein n=1 Tax=Microbacterium sp. LWH10-1.2 TaxID=3135255 RepID=UPI003138F828